VRLDHDLGDRVDGAQLPGCEHLVKQVDRGLAAHVTGEMWGDVRQEAAMAGGDALLAARAGA
jgi:hypothetical protein